MALLSTLTLLLCSIFLCQAQESYVNVAVHPHNQSIMEPHKYTLPPLPYAYDALEPHISAQIMELHHSKHHSTYIANLNAAVATHAAAVAAGDVPAQIAGQAALRFHGGGHINHCLFWANLAPAGSVERGASTPRLGEAVRERWGGWDAFEDAFGKALLGIQGSGWGWLVKTDEGRLEIRTTKDQDPVVGGDTPVLGVDMWEHAYYLQYLNSKAEYVKNIWKVINWKTAEERYVGGPADAFKVLKASM